MKFEDWTPPTDPKGSLEPPKRRPPTAVGVMTPPPPRRPSRPARLRGMSGTRAVALGFLSVLCLVAGPVIAATGDGVLIALAGTGSALFGGRIAWRLAHVRRAPRVEPQKRASAGPRSRAA